MSHNYIKNKHIKNKHLPIGVFDSGLGGISVLATLRKVLPQEKFLYYGDSINAPYGEKSSEDVIGYSNDIVDWFITKGVKAIVIACNTATSVSASILRRQHDIPIIGIEPALKPAVMKFKSNNFHDSNKKIAVMATDITLREKKFYTLSSSMGMDNKILKIPCPELVKLVEKGITYGENVEKAIKNHFYSQGIDDKSICNIQSIVLGCTHFSFLRKSISNIFGENVEIFDGNTGTALHLKRVLEQNNLLLDKSSILDNLDDSNNPNIVHLCDDMKRVCIYNSLSDEMSKKSEELLSLYINSWDI